MVQQTLIDYIKSQKELGVSGSEIKNTLVGAGWQEADISDSFKSVEGPPAQSVASAPAVTGGSSAMEEQKPKDPVFFSPGKMADAAKFSGEENRADTGNKVDIGNKKFSFPFGSSPGSSSGGPGLGVDPANLKGGQVGDKVVAGGLVDGTKPASSPFGIVKKKEDSRDVLGKKEQEEKPEKIKAAGGKFNFHLPKVSLTTAILAVLVVGLAAVSVWMYLDSAGLKKNIVELQGAGSGTDAQVSGLNSEIASLTGNLQSVTAENKLLLMELSFLVVPPGGQTEESEVSGLKAMVHGGGDEPYSLITSNGVEIAVLNSEEIGVGLALAPFVGEEAEISGTYISGSSNIEITSVNGVAVLSGAEDETAE